MPDNDETGILARTDNKVASGVDSCQDFAVEGIVIVWENPIVVSISKALSFIPDRFTLELSFFRDASAYLVVAEIIDTKEV